MNMRPLRISFLFGGFLSVALFALLTSSCGSRAASTDTANARADATPIVPVAKVARTNLSSDITLTAEFIPYQEVDLMAKVAGYVRSIKVDIGDQVRTGQSLAELEVPEMRDDMAKASAAVEAAEAEIITARDDVARARSAHEMAHLSFTRIQEVMKREPGLVPQQESDEVRSKDFISEAELSAAQSKLSSAERKAAMSRAERARWSTLQNYTNICAPFSGVITKRYANTGSMVQAGTASQTQAMPVVRLAQDDVLRLILPVPESAVPGIHIGQSAEVTVATLQRTFPGRITRFTHKVDTSTRTMETEVDVQNPKQVLVPGMYAELKLQMDGRRNVLAVPLDALDTSAANPYVFVVRNSQLSLVPVTLGLQTAQSQEIRSGLNEGDLVVVGRHAGLRNGEPVQAKLGNDENEGSKPGPKPAGREQGS